MPPGRPIVAGPRVSHLPALLAGCVLAAGIIHTAALVPYAFAGGLLTALPAYGTLLALGGLATNKSASKFQRKKLCEQNTAKKIG